MAERFMRRLFVSLTGAALVAGCSGGSGGASSGSGSGSSASGSSGESASGGVAGGVTFSCTLSGIVCVQIVAPPSAMAAEKSACMGTFSVGTCPPAGIVACCDKGVEDDCYFAGSTLSLFQSECKGTWTTADGGVASDDGGASGAAAFVGTWARSGSQTVTCPGGTTTNAITGNLVITAGTTAATITATQPDGCATTYSVSGNVASASAGQTCNTTTEGGVAELTTVVSHTLTLSADGSTLTSVGNETLDKTATMTMCTTMGMGTYTKE
jgi:hypothetical protein